MGATSSLADPVRASDRASEAPFAAVEVSDDPAAVMPAWRALLDPLGHSAYQRPEWVVPWLRHAGAAAGLAPRFVLARDAAGRPAALLTLAVARRGGLRVAGFAGGRHANYHLPLLRADLAGAATPGAWAALLRRAARPAGIDLYVLLNQPLAWEGRPNALALLGRPSPDDGHRLALLADPEAAVNARLSKDARKKLRQKEARLLAAGPLRVERAADAAGVDRALTAFAAQKAAQFAARGIADPFAAPGVAAFLRAAALEGLAEGRPGLSLFALLHGAAGQERALAVFGAALDGRRACGTFTSYDADPEVARSSPGDLLLREVVRALAAGGHATFDLGVGEARYKTTWCDAREPLRDVVLGAGPAGRLGAPLLASALEAKRALKASPRAMALLASARALRGRDAPAG